MNIGAELEAELIKEGMAQDIKNVMIINAFCRATAVVAEAGGLGEIPTNMCFLHHNRTWRNELARYEKAQTRQ